MPVSDNSDEVSEDDAKFFNEKETEEDVGPANNDTEHGSLMVGGVGSVGGRSSLRVGGKSYQVDKDTESQEVERRVSWVDQPIQGKKKGGDLTAELGDSPISWGKF
mmetsp:Transcript_41258/g.87924  ORF Transcript_41258/g.87924 Transcript_41258/m.87924 type:complete len:106 (+) Transcript_41258:879-1196(+)